jgi:hypothetical protein
VMTLIACMPMHACNPVMLCQAGEQSTGGAADDEAARL